VGVCVLGNERCSCAGIISEGVVLGGTAPAVGACFEVFGEGFFVPASLCAGSGGRVLAVACADSAAAGRFWDLEGG
jgi:hypothetical protein